MQWQRGCVHALLRDAVRRNVLLYDERAELVAALGEALLTFAPFIPYIPKEGDDE